MEVRIRSVTWEADGVLRYRLEPMAGRRLPGFTAGAHIQLTVGDLVRSYSLLNDPADGAGYDIAVQLDPASRGGSRRMHEEFRPGQVVRISEPDNHFPLDETAPYSVLIAGGIGITPLLSMVARLDTLGQPWELHYAASSRDRAPFVEVLEAKSGTSFYRPDLMGGSRLDIGDVIRQAPPHAHFYCCGPARMIDEFKRLCADLPASQVHLEYFSADTALATDGGYTLELARSGRQVEVQQGETMLDALLNAGVNVGFACSEGICGSCRVKVLGGEPDHRDLFLSEEEKAGNQAVMVCCSGARTATLVLDL